MARSKTRALVLGGGGIAGIAWETGVLFGLAEHAVDVLDADLVIGTSAGAAVAAQITSGTPLGQLYDTHVFPDGPSTEIAAQFDAEALMAQFAVLLESREPGTELRAAIGSMALAAPTVDERRRRAAIAARLPQHDWPDRDVRIVTVDAATGAERIFTSADGVDLVDVVAASCAVPGVWPPATVDGRRYMDGGVRSSTNVDLAADATTVLVLRPFADIGPGDPEITKVAAKVEKRKGTLIVEPDDASKEAIGLNPLDPATAKPSAQAGRAQGAGLVDEVRELWGG